MSKQQNQKNKGIFIVGTDTDVGKTYVTALIMKKLLEEGIHAVYFKAALSGAEEINGEWIPGDAAYVCQVSGLQEAYDRMVTYSLKEPVSPHLAASLENKEIHLETILAYHKSLSEQYGYIVAEGSGGIVCPLKITETETLLLEDVVKALGYEVILVARAGLGTINHTCLTIAYLKAHSIAVKGIILNYYEQGNPLHKDNAKVIQHLTGIPIIAYVEQGLEPKEIVLDIEKLY